MADTYTTNLNLTKPEPGAAEDTWGISLNADLDSLDAIFGSGGTAVSMGAVTLDGLTVQTTQGDIAIANSASSLNFTRAGTNYIRATDAAGHFKFITGANDFATQRLNIASNGDISFYDDTGSTQGLFWDASAERLGIGTTSPTAPLEVSGNIIATGNLISYVSTSSPIIYGGSTALELKSNTGELFAKFLNNGAAELYYDNSKKLETTSSGIDVTGTATMDGLTVDGEGRIEETGAAARLVVSRTDAANAAATASVDLLEGSVGGSFGSANNYGFSIDLDGSANSLNILSGVQTLVTKRFQIGRDTGDISFYDDTGSTQGLFWDASAERLGIGTTSPWETLSIPFNEKLSFGSSAYPFSISRASAGELVTTFEDGYNSSNARIEFKMRGGAVTPLSILGSGNVGIGTSSPSATLELSNSSTAPKLRLSNENNSVAAGGDLGVIEFYSGDDSGFGDLVKASISGTQPLTSPVNGELVFKTSSSSTSLSEAMRISADGSVGIGTSSPSALIHGSGSNAELRLQHAGNSYYQRIFTDSSNNLKFGTGANGTERMRLDASGNFLVGKTSAVYNTAGTQLAPDGQVFITGGNQYGLAVNRTTGDGDIVLFSKDGSTVGSIGTNSGALYISSPYGNDSGLRFVSNIIAPATTTGANRDAAIDLGYSSGRFKDLHLSGTANADSGFQVGSIGNIGNRANDVVIFSSSTGHNGLRFHVNGILPTDNTGAIIDDDADLGIGTHRFKDIYATNGTIQTSDINEKQDIEELSEAETRVAVAAKGLLKKYRWKSAVADKGDDARIHFGIMAQDLQQAFSAEGLDAGDYGMFISSTWTDETTGEEKTRLGVRYNELLAFIIAAI